MRYQVVCISGTDGAGAGEVAELVAHGLGYRLVNEQIVMRAAREAGVESHVVADVELRKSFVKRLLDSLSATAGETALAFGGGYDSAISDIPSDADLRALIRAALEETAVQGRVVIFAHAASIALAGRQDVLRVLVTASPETRAHRLVASNGQGGKEAADRIRESDAGRAAYLEQFYGIKRERPIHYDLVINTDRLTPAQAAGLVLESAK